MWQALISSPLLVVVLLGQCLGPIPLYNPRQEIFIDFLRYVFQYHTHDSHIPIMLFSPKFPDEHSEICVCSHWLSAPGKSKIMHFGIILKYTQFWNIMLFLWCNSVNMLENKSLCLIERMIYATHIHILVTPNLPYQ